MVTRVCFLCGSHFSCVFEPFIVLWYSPQCPDSCAVVGRRHREVQCVDSQSKRPLRPFHCQAMSSRPLSTLTCPHKPCMTWSISPWGPVGALYRSNGNDLCPILNRCRYKWIGFYSVLSEKQIPPLNPRFFLLSALAAVVKACGSGWCTALRLIAVAPRWGQTAQSRAVWSPVPNGKPRTGRRSVTHDWDFLQAFTTFLFHKK